MGIKIENNLRKRELIDYKSLCRQQQQQVDLLTSALEDAEQARDDIEQELNDLRELHSKQEEVDAERNKHTEELLGQLAIQQEELQQQKRVHSQELENAKDGMSAQLVSLQEEIR